MRHDKTVWFLYVCVCKTAVLKAVKRVFYVEQWKRRNNLPVWQILQARCTWRTCCQTRRNWPTCWRTSWVQPLLQRSWPPLSIRSWWVHVFFFLFFPPVFVKVAFSWWCWSNIALIWKAVCRKMVSVRNRQGERMVLNRCHMCRVVKIVMVGGGGFLVWGRVEWCRKAKKMSRFFSLQNSRWNWFSTVAWLWRNWRHVCKLGIFFPLQIAYNLFRRMYWCILCAG